MLKITTRFISVALATLAAVTTFQAGVTPRTVDTRSILTAAPSKDASVQATAFTKSLNLQREAAQLLFADRPTELHLTNFPLPGHPDATLVLRRTRDVIDASSEIYTSTKNGRKRVTVSPITSYSGTVNDDAATRVSLHYSADDLTGIIDMGDGERLLVGRDGNIGMSVVPHSVTVEGSIEGGSLLKNFICGAEELPITAETLERAAKDAQAEVVQNGYLRQIRVALEIKEDIDSVMKRRGMNDDQIFQYIVKLWAAISQVYEQELNATLFLNYMHKFSEDDPSPYSANGRNPGDLLVEFTNEWRQRASPQRSVAHLMALIRPSGGSYVGGIAWGGNMNSNLCNPTSSNGSYSVSTIYTTANDVPGQPTRQNGFVWDMFVIAHELGHNVGANHTHNCSWNPPLDTCQLAYAIDGTDGCVNNVNLRRAQAGTIMSYCHLVNGSTTPLTFGPARITSRMAGWIASSACVTAAPNPTVRLTAPRGSESWNAGQSVDILWVSEGMTNVKLEYSPDEGGQWVEIVASVPTGFKKFTWTVPNVGTTRLLIRISDVEDPSIFHVSLAKYTILVPQLPTISLVKPVGGERIRKGSRYTITWTKLSVGTVSIDFAPDGVAWSTLKADTNSTNYVWQVPDIITSEARIRVRSASDPSVNSTSNAFAIGAARFELIKPRTGDTLCTNVENGFIWSADFVSRIKIRYSTDGTTLKNAIGPITVPVGPGMAVSSPGNTLKDVASGTQVWLHIIDDDSDSVIATITGLIAAQCGTPNSVAGEDVSSTDLAVVGVTPSPANQNAVLTLSTSKPMTLNVSLVDMAGNATTLLGNVIVEGSGLHYLNLPLETVASGAYMISVRAGSFQVSTPLRIAR